MSPLTQTGSGQNLNAKIAIIIMMSNKTGVKMTD